MCLLASDNCTTPTPSRACAATALQAMLSVQPVVSDVAPPDLLSRQISLLGPVVMDAVPRGAAFGDVLLQPLPAYRPGQQVEAMFRWADIASKMLCVLCMHEYCTGAHAGENVRCPAGW
jgi:hypothetical protein